MLPPIPLCGPTLISRGSPTGVSSAAPTATRQYRQRRTALARLRHSMLSVRLDRVSGMPPILLCRTPNGCIVRATQAPARQTGMSGFDEAVVPWSMYVRQAGVLEEVDRVDPVPDDDARDQ
jgi:hypothetical protein